MWLSEERCRKPAAEAAAEWGPVTISEPAAVYLAGERRQVPVCAPGGYVWRPAVGEEVLVLKAGNQTEQPFILGKTRMEEKELRPGEVRIQGGTCTILLGEKMELAGDVRINGETLPEMIRRIVAQLLGLPGGEEEKEEGEET